MPGEVRASAYWSAPSAISSASLPSSPSPSSAFALGLIAPTESARWAASRSRARAPKGLLLWPDAALAGIATSAADAVMAQVVSHRLLRVGTDTGVLPNRHAYGLRWDLTMGGRKCPALGKCLTGACHFVYWIVDRAKGWRPAGLLPSRLRVCSVLVRACSVLTLEGAERDSAG